MDLSNSWMDFDSKMDLELNHLKEEDLDININEISEDICK